MIKVFATGNLGSDAELKQVGNTSVVQFNIASTKKGYTKQDGTVVDDVTTWINVKKWKADGLAPYLTKGVRVAVSGELEIREHEGKYYTSIVSHDIEFMSKRDNNSDAPF